MFKMTFKNPRHKVLFNISCGILTLGALGSFIQGLIDGYAKL